MLSLKDLQQAFKRHLYDTDPTIAEHIVGTAELDTHDRLAVYAHAYDARLTEALATDYTALQALLGEDEFARLSHAYARAHPSTHYSLRYFGQHLPAFLERNDDYAPRPQLAELARFEWAFVDAFDAADTAVVDEATAAAVPMEAWPSLRMTFHPSLRTVPLNWNTLELWKAGHDGTDIPAARMMEALQVCLVWRHELTTQYRVLDPDEAVALAAARGGADFAGLCELLLEWQDDDTQVAVRAVSLLKGWLAAGLITALDYPN